MRASPWARCSLVVAAVALSAGPALADTGQISLHSVESFLAEPVVSGVLLALGMVSLVLAVITLGAGLAESTTVLFFSLFFAGRYMAGHHVWLPGGLFLLGLVLLGLEVFVARFGFLGVSGLALLGTSVVLCFGDIMTGLVVLAASLLGATVAGLLAMTFLPQSRLFQQFVALKPPAPTGTSPTVVAPAGPVLSPGDLGISKTPLRPTGIAEFDGKRVDVVTEGDYVPRGLYVEIMAVQGNRVVVKATPGQE